MVDVLGAHVDPAHAGLADTSDLALLENAQELRLQPGADLSDLAFYRCFNSWKIACILHGVYARYCEGKKSTDGIDLVEMRGRISRGLELAEEAINRLS